MAAYATDNHFSARKVQRKIHRIDNLTRSCFLSSPFQIQPDDFILFSADVAGVVMHCFSRPYILSLLLSAWDVCFSSRLLQDTKQLLRDEQKVISFRAYDFEEMLGPFGSGVLAGG